MMVPGYTLFGETSGQLKVSGVAGMVSTVAGASWRVQRDNCASHA